MMAAVRVGKFFLAKNLLKEPTCRAITRRFSEGRTKHMVQSSLGPIAIGLGSGVIVGAGLGIYKFQKVKAPASSSTLKINDILEKLPEVPIARRVVSPTDSSGLHLVLFQYPTCPFCCKVRAFLDYYGFSYDVVEVDPVLRKEMKWTDYKKVPVLLAKVDGGYQQLNDSTMIISVLRSFLHDKDTGLRELVNFYPVVEFEDDKGLKKSDIMNKYFLMYNQNVPASAKNEIIIEERDWRKWADDSLVHMLSPNVYRTLDEAMQAFKWFSEVGEWDRLFPAWERNLIVYMGAYAMYFISKGLKKRHALKEDVRQSLYDDCYKWMRAIRTKGTKFMGGSTPNLADLAVYGVLSSIEGCTAFQDLKANTKIGEWYYPMKEAVSQHKGVQEILK